MALPKGNIDKLTYKDPAAFQLLQYIRKGHALNLFMIAIKFAQSI